MDPDQRRQLIIVAIMVTAAILLLGPYFGLHLVTSDPAELSPDARTVLPAAPSASEERVPQATREETPSGGRRLDEIESLLN